MIDFGQIYRPKTEDEVLGEVRIEAPATISQQVVTSRTDTTESAYLLKPAAEWTWQDLRDYVIAEAEKRFGPQVRDPKKGTGIFKGFMQRHGTEDAVAVAMAAFEVYEGTWRKAPVTVTRFCRNSDPFFADVILARLKG